MEYFCSILQNYIAKLQYSLHTNNLYFLFSSSVSSMSWNALPRTWGGSEQTGGQACLPLFFFCSSVSPDADVWSISICDAQQCLLLC